MAVQSKKTHFIAWVLFIAIFSGLLFGFYTLRHLGANAKSPQPSSAPAVVVSKPFKDFSSPIYKEVGQTESINKVDLKSRVQGELVQINFIEGSHVEKGDVLFQIEKREYEASVASAQANLVNAKSEHTKAAKYLKRLKNTLKEGVAEKLMDEAVNSEKTAAANVVKAEANLKIAQLDLEYTTIKAPIAGRIGKVTVTKGNIVNLQTGTLATIVQIDPIYAVFAIGEDKALSLSNKSNEIAEANVYIELSNGKKFEYPGKIAFMDNNVNSTAGTVLMRATFPNPEELLIPGQFANVLIQQKEQKERLSVPGAAVLQDQIGSYVLIVDKDTQAIRTSVTTGEQLGQLIEIRSGLKEDDVVIYQGMEKVQAGGKVTPEMKPVTNQAPEVKSEKL